MKFRLLFILIFAIVGSFFFIACEKESFYESPDSKISFSKDTLRFDTVFTTLGSATRFIKIFNPYDKTLKINKIYLENGTQSIFNLNIDGVSGDSQENIEIPAKDSIYVFAEVTINPNDQNNPFIIDENMVVEIGTNKQKLVLEAWGQNANYIPANNAKGKISLINTDQVWNDPKPYVIYGILAIENAKLTLAAGTKVYIHGGIVKTNTSQGNTVVYNDGSIFVLEGGSIEAQGTKAKPVLIGGDRLEKDFNDVPAQWNLIRLLPGASAKFSYTTIKNARLGVFVDSTATATFDYCKIYNTAGPGIFARQASVKLENSLIFDNGSTSFTAVQGGDYDIKYSTIANYGKSASALFLANNFCIATDKDGNCIQRIHTALNATVTNSIVMSSQRDAIDLSKSDKAPMNFAFDNDVVKVEELLKPKGFPKFLTDNCKNCVQYKGGAEKLFKKIDIDNYHLDTLSIAEKKARPLVGFDYDLDGVARNPQMPSIGAYEYKPK